MLTVNEKTGSRKWLGISKKQNKKPIKNVEGDLLYPIFSTYMLGLSQ